MVMPRSRGAVSGVLLILAGLWAGFVPFIGPYLTLSVGSDDTWDYTNVKLRLSILPAVAVVLGGLLVLRAANRAVGSLGGWLALAGGVWLVIGPSMSLLWNDGRSETGRALGTTSERVLSQLTWYQGIGALIIALAAFALGRLALRGEGDRELVAAGAAPVETDRDRAIARRDGLAAERERERERETVEPVAAAPVAEREPGEPVKTVETVPAGTAAAPEDAAARRERFAREQELREQDADEAGVDEEPVTAVGEPAPATAVHPRSAVSAPTVTRRKGGLLSRWRG